MNSRNAHPFDLLLGVDVLGVSKRTDGGGSQAEKCSFIECKDVVYFKLPVVDEV